MSIRELRVEDERPSSPSFVVRLALVLTTGRLSGAGGCLHRLQPSRGHHHRRNTKCNRACDDGVRPRGEGKWSHLIDNEDDSPLRHLLLQVDCSITPPRMPALHQNLLAELGLLSLFSSPRDVKLLILQRFTRFFAFGGSTIVLALYLHALHISDAQIGLFMTLALVGDVVSFALTVCADGVGRRRVLMVGAGLMAASGSVLAYSGSFWLLLVAAVFGVLSPKYVVFPSLTGIKMIEKQY